MSLEIYAAYLAAAMVVLIIPGPTILLVVGYALRDGKRSVWPATLGVGAGDMVAMVASLTGLGALFATSATLFTVLKWIGAAYLVFLGIKMWRAKPRLDLDNAPQRTSKNTFLNAFVVTALNPKGFVFFIAFLPQFVVTSAPVPPQLALLGLTFVFLGVVNAAIYGWLAAHGRSFFQNQRTLTIAHRAGGTALIGAGLLTAAIKRSI